MIEAHSDEASDRRRSAYGRAVDVALQIAGVTERLNTDGDADPLVPLGGGFSLDVRDSHRIDAGTYPGAATFTGTLVDSMTGERISTGMVSIDQDGNAHLTTFDAPATESA